jgi:hypothetical protein
VPKVYPTPVSASVLGTTVTFSAPTAGAGNGDAVRPNNVIHVRNGATASSLTILYGATVDGQAVTSKTVTLPSSTDLLIGPFSNSAPQSSGTDAGLVYVEYTNVTTVTRAVYTSPF